MRIGPVNQKAPRSFGNETTASDWRLNRVRLGIGKDRIMQHAIKRAVQSAYDIALTTHLWRSF